MTPDAILREWFQKLWNEGDETTITRLAHPEAVIHGLSHGEAPVHGTAEFFTFYRGLKSAFPDIRVSVERTVSEGAFTTGHCVVTGHHTGPGLPIAPTNKAVRFEGICMLRVVNGVIVEAWNFFDFLGFYQQIGYVNLRA
jgi:predicted ester cyclase